MQNYTCYKNKKTIEEFNIPPVNLPPTIRRIESNTTLVRGRFTCPGGYELFNNKCYAPCPANYTDNSATECSINNLDMIYPIPNSNSCPVNYFPYNYDDPYSRSQRLMCINYQYPFTPLATTPTQTTPVPTTRAAGPLATTPAPTTRAAGTPTGTLTGTPTGTLTGTPTGTLTGTPTATRSATTKPSITTKPAKVETIIPGVPDLYFYIGLGVVGFILLLLIIMMMSGGSRPRRRRYDDDD